MNYRLMVLYGLVIINALLIIVYFQFDQLVIYTRTINPFIWMGLGIISIFFTLNTAQRVKSKTEKAQTVFIAVVSILILYFLSGLIVGFAHSPYSLTLSGILKNIWIFIVADIFKAYYRTSLVKLSKKDISAFFLITVLFIISDANLFLFFSQSIDATTTFQNVFAILLPLLIRNTIMTYLALTCGFASVIAYILPLSLINIILPVFPNYDWFMISLKEIIIALVVYLAVNYLHISKSLKMSKRILRKEKPIALLPIILFIFLLGGFMAGFFKYSPLGIMSNSMAPYIVRGDVVIVKNIEQENVKKLKENDIIKYIYQNQYIVHRIVEVIEEEDSVKFKTKGDNNKVADLDYVLEKQVKGIITRRIPKIGYPSVWLSEQFGRTRPDIEM